MSSWSNRSCGVALREPARLAGGDVAREHAGGELVVARAAARAFQGPGLPVP